MLHISKLFTILALNILLEVLSSDSVVSGSLDHAIQDKSLKSHDQVFVVPDLNETPSENHTSMDGGNNVLQRVLYDTSGAMIDHSPTIRSAESEQIDLNRISNTPRKKRYSELSKSQKAKKNEYEVQRIRNKKQRMTDEERAAWNARNLEYVRRHRARQPKAKLQAQGRRYKENYKAKQEAKLKAFQPHGNTG